MRQDLVLVLPTLEFGKWRENHASWGQANRVVMHGLRPLTAAYQEGYKNVVAGFPQAEVIGFLHDDVCCFDPQWADRVMHEFADPTVGLVGFGGSTGHGHPALTDHNYQWESVGRTGTFMSNMVNAEQHGMRMQGAAEASVLDGFAMFVRRSVLDNSPYGGWPLGLPITYWAYDYWLSCETRRQGKRVRVVGVSCEHTCPPEYRSYVVKEDEGGGQGPCVAAHDWLWANYRQQFPAAVPLQVEP